MYSYAVKAEFSAAITPVFSDICDSWREQHLFVK